MSETVKYDKQYEPIVLSKPLFDLFLKQKNPSDCISLYSFYYYVAKWQETNQAKSTTGFAAKGLKWSEARVRKTKKTLLELGLIEDRQVRNKETQQIEGWYIKVNFIWKTATLENLSHPAQNSQGGLADTVDNLGTNALSNNNINALSNNILNATTLTPPTMSATQPSTVSGLGVAYNQKSVTTNMLHTEENINPKNFNSEEICLNNKLDGGDPRTAAKPSASTQSVDIRQMFEEVWKLYPRKEGKQTAFKKYEKIAKKTPNLISIILEKVKIIHQFNELIKTDQFIETRYSHIFKHFSTWLNGECWEEDLIQNVLDSTITGNRRAYKLIYDKFRSEPVAKTESFITQTKEVSDGDYFNTMMNLY